MRQDIAWCYRHNCQVIHMREYVEGDQRVWCVIADETKDEDYREDTEGVQIGGCSVGRATVTNE